MAKENFTALLGAGTEYVGTLSFKGTVRIDGKFDGEINSDGRLIIGKGATVSGTISVGELLVNGKVNADIIVTKGAFLHKEAEVYGSLSTPRLEMEEGAILQGTLQMQSKDTPTPPQSQYLSSKATLPSEEIIKQ